MCIIIAKPMGAQFAPKSNVSRACEANPDGFGIAYYTKGDSSVQVFRTLDVKLFKKRYAEVCKRDPKTTAVLIHARIKTHGTVKLENVHCWHDEASGLVFAHNGILSIKNRDDMTDSETFFRDIFIPILSFGGWEAANKAINAIIGTSKFAFLNTSGEIFTYGQYIKDRGVLYSNTSYKERVTTFHSPYRSPTYIYGVNYVYDADEHKYVYKAFVDKKTWDEAYKKYLDRSTGYLRDFDFD